MDDENLEDNYEDISFLPKRHLLLKWGGVFIAVVIVLVVGWELSAIPSNTAELTYAGSRQPSGREPRAPLALGDSGVFDPAKIVATTGITAATDTVDAAQIQDLKTILGNDSPSTLVGQRVNLQIPLLRENNQSIMWLGDPDNPLLVVLSRDVRDGFERMASRPSAHAIQLVEPGQQATISGTIQRLPSKEMRFSWNLNQAQVRRLQRRGGIYLLADSVRTVG